MKKKKPISLKKEKGTNQDIDFSSLNSALGSFDLEPPKHYRPEQRIKQNDNKTGFNQKSPQQKRREQRKRRRRSKVFYKAVSIIAISVAVIAVVITLCLTVCFKIDDIKVTGNKKYTQEQIIEMLPIEKQKNLFLTDTKGASQELEKALPYVFKAEIKRKLPSTVVVNITETPKVYSIKTQEKNYILMDQNFKLLEAGVNKRPKNSVEIKKAEIKSVVAGKPVKFNKEQTEKDLKAMTELIDRLKLDEISAISSVDVNTNSMVYDGRITIKLGTTEKLENKVYSALAAIEKLNESDPNAEGVITATSDKQIYFTEK